MTDQDRDKDIDIDKDIDMDIDIDMEHKGIKATENMATVGTADVPGNSGAVGTAGNSGAVGTAGNFGAVGISGGSDNSVGNAGGPSDPVGNSGGPSDYLADKIAHENYYQTVFRRFKRHKLGYVSLIFLFITLILIIVVPRISPYGPNQITGSFRQAPSAAHWFGTDREGRDMLTRVFTGAGVSLFVAFLATLISSVVGVVLGLISGYFGGWFDTVIMRITDVVMSFPYMLLVLVAAAIFGPGMWNIILIMGFVNWPGMARMVRSNVMSLRKSNYVLGAQVAGMPNRYILFKEILPNTIAPVLIYATTVMAQTMLDEAALSFLGMGVQPPTASLGNLLNVAQSFSILENYVWMWLPPGILTVLLVVAVNFVGDALRDAFDPRNLQ